MDIDPDKLIPTAGGGLFGIGALWYWFKNMRRRDTQEAVINEAYIELIEQLRSEVKSLRDEVSSLHITVKNCEHDKAEMYQQLQSFIRRFGTRQGEDKCEPQN